MVKTRKGEGLPDLKCYTDMNEAIKDKVAAMEQASVEPLRPMKTLDERLLRKPTASVTITSNRGSPSTSGGVGNEFVGTNTGIYDEPMTSSGVRFNKRVDILSNAKLDNIIGTLATLQESVRELHNEFSSIKPRVSQFKTSSSGSTMLVRSNVADDPTETYKIMLNKRKNKLTQEHSGS